MDRVARAEPSGSSWQGGKTVVDKQQKLEQLEHNGSEIQEGFGAQNICVVVLANRGTIEVDRVDNKPKCPALNVSSL